MKKKVTNLSVLLTSRSIRTIIVHLFYLEWTLAWSIQLAYSPAYPICMLKFIGLHV